MQNSLKIAVTGGIGSGKSTVCKIIGELGFPVISCDQEYKELLRSGNIIQTIAQEFKNILTDSGELDKTKLAEIVFSDKEKLLRLNSITHPKIMAKIYETAQTYPVCFCEVPLLFEGGYDKDFNAIIVVLRDKEERIKSVIKRDGFNETVVKSRLAAQIDYDYNDFAQYYVIHNDGNFEDLRKQTLSLIEKMNLYK